MKVLVINSGSSSLKYQLIDMETELVIAKGNCERIGIEGSKLVHKAKGEEFVFEQAMTNHNEAVSLVLKALTDEKSGVISSMEDIDAVGHRAVASGEVFKKPTLVSEESLKALEEIQDLAPLHNPAAIIGVKACLAAMPKTPMALVFDTSFHFTMPDYAYMYGINYEAYEKYSIRRYGFHGTSHRYVSARVCEFLGVDPKGKKIVTAHIGNGGSCAAVMDGKSVDTSMGLTPVEGLMMGTRVGDLDLGAATYIMDKEGMDTAAFNTLINKKSGLFGVSGVSSDACDIDNAVREGNARANLAREMFIYRVKKYIGAYAAAMNGVDIIVFTGGIGENDDYVREGISTGLTYLGAEFDKEANKVRGEERVISTPNSKVTICIIPTDEELMIASDTAALI